MRFNPAWSVIVPLLLAVAEACTRQPAARPYGTVEIQLAGADADGTPQRLYGEFTFSGVDDGVFESASIGPLEATDVLEVRLPAGRYTLTLNDAFVVVSMAPDALAIARPRKAWIHPARPPLVGVDEGEITRVHFDLVSADRPPLEAGASRREAAPHAIR